MTTDFPVIPLKSAGFWPAAAFNGFCRDMKANGYTVEREGDTMIAKNGPLIVARALRMHGKWMLRVDPRAVQFAEG